MGWPVATDYQGAIQNPQTCFADPDLQNGRAKENRLGLPEPSSGQFAVVFQMSTSKGRWAVKCFTTQIEDHRRRYAAVSDHLQNCQLKCAVRFDYLAQGIRVDGNWYPIVKMEWVDGEPLDSFVANRLNESTRLLQLAREWVVMMKELKAARIAHGDLQHGNVLVTTAGIRLIDYDGMYVPALAGMQSHEQGHRNYQHPKRTGADFGEYVDNFSAWVVFHSIFIVAHDPRMWQLLNGGDDCLLFRRDDFSHPERSRAFQILQRSRPEVRAIADEFKSHLRLSIRNVPALDGRIFTQERIASQPTQASPIPDWVRDHVRREPAPMLEPALTAETDAPSFTGADWIIEHLVKQQTPAIILRRHSFAIERVAMLLLVVVVITLIIASIQGAVSTVVGAVGIGGASGVVVMLFIIRYGIATNVKERRTILDKLRAANSVLKVFSSQMKEVATTRKEVVSPLVKLESQFRKLQQAKNQELASVQQQIQSSRLLLGQERQKLASDENSALLSAEAGVRQQSATLQIQLNGLNHAEQLELTQAATRHGDEYIRHRLESTMLRDASLYRITPNLKGSLEMEGVRSAAEVDYRRVRRAWGIGPVLAGVLQRWRDEVEAAARQSVPPLPSGVLDSIHRSYASRKRDIENQISSTTQHAHRMREDVLKRYQQDYYAIDELERESVTKCNTDEQLIRAKYDHELGRIDREHRPKKAQLSAILKEHDSRLTELNRQRTQQRFEACKLECEINLYKRLTWGRYIARIIGFGQAA